MLFKHIPGRSFAFAVLCLFLHLSSALAQESPSTQANVSPTGNSKISTAEKQKIAAAAINLPIFFEANQGQTDPSVQFLTRGQGYTLLLTPTETVFAESKTRVSPGRQGFSSVLDSKPASMAHTVVRMQLVGANLAPAMTGLSELPGKINYLIGNDPSQWHTGVPLYSNVRTEQVYPGVDLLFHGDQKQLEYDFVVAPGADPSKIAFRIHGAARIEIDPHGDLVLRTADSDFRMHKPVIYQMVASERRPVDGSFVRKGKRGVAFRLGDYDHSQPLVIDPAIGYSTFLGGSGDDQPSGLALDTSNSAAPKLYVTGFTSSITTFPEASNPLIGHSGGTVYGFVAKIDPTITNDPGGPASLNYLTFIGGGTPFSGASCESAFEIVSMDTSQGPSSIQPVVTGLTDCSDYPGTQIQPITGGFASVATRLTVSGAAVDASVLLGGNGTTNGSFSSVDGSGNVMIAGSTSTTNLPTTTGAYMTTFNKGGAGTDDCFVAKLPRSGLTPPSYLTYLNTGGGSTSSSQVGCGAIEDSAGKIDAGGNTVSATAFDVGVDGANLANGFQTTFQGTQDTFGMRLDPTLSGTAELLYATYYGGGGVTNATNGALDLGNGVVAIGGYTTSNGGTNAPNIPLQNAYQATNLAAATSGETGFLVVLNTEQTGAASLLCSTYFGGSSGSDEVHAVTYDAGDPTAFRIILGGQTRSGTDFPTSNPLQAFQGVQDGFVSSLKVPLRGQTFNAGLYFSSYIGGGVQSSSESERITGVAVDTNHTIYATGRTISADFFGNLTTRTMVNGFQTTCKSCGGSPPLDDAVVFSISTTPGATLQSITITPASATIAESQTQQFRAEGFYLDGTIQDITTSVTWGSSNTAIAQISNTTGTNGLATAGTTAGQTTISASLSGLNSSNSPVLTVNGSSPVLAITKTHTGNFTQGQSGATYTVTVSNGASAGPTNGTVTVKDTIPTGLTLVSMAGTGWTCVMSSCTRSDVLAAGASYPSITVTVNVASNAPGSVVNAVSVSGGGSATANATDTTTITTGTALTVTEAGTGSGTVTSAPTGINCPTTCSVNFASGAQVTLTASPADGSTFAGWSGAGCTGTGTCVVTVIAATAVTATFNSASPVTIGIGQGSTSTVTTTPGSSAVFGLVLIALPGTTGTVQLTCSSPVASITCSIVPSSIILTGKAIDVAIVVQTFCKGSLPNFVPMPGGFGTGLGLLLATLCLCGAAWTYKKQPRWIVSFGLLIIFAAGMSACGNLAKSPSGQATPPGSYPLVVTATAPNGATSSVNLTLVVK
jgi:hypothetical protein